MLKPDPLIYIDKLESCAFTLSDRNLLLFQTVDLGGTVSLDDDDWQLVTGIAACQVATIERINEAFGTTFHFDIYNPEHDQ